ncbi:FAD-dependent oxidoreductase [Halobacteriaceae archaeon GCM10025711]
MTATVTVLGGGIGGLSAAHELAARGFDVTVYEARDRFGGKARSVPVPGTGEPPLPGEHGFRFFPGFYRHVVDTMARIPLPDGRTAEDNLVPTERTLVASVADDARVRSTRTPRTLRDWATVLRDGFGADVPASERAFFTERMLELLTSCAARREAELDDVTWWEYIEAGRMSAGYRKQLAQSTQSLVALRPEQASARTVGRIYAQILRAHLSPAVDTERVLNGPTSEAWIDPWLAHLRERGVTLHANAPVRDLHHDGRRITGITVERDGERERVTADYYVAAVPVEMMARLVDDDLAAAAPSLDRLRRLETAWMNGVQFYLTEETPIVEGHTIYADSPWALTSISQSQFWETDLRERGDGDVAGVLSVIVSDWETPGVLFDKPARECTPEEIREEVWVQLTTHLNREREVLREESVVDWFLDPALEPTDDGVRNTEPLLVNTVGSLRNRPDAETELPNLFLAADYVRTNTDLACMESANEAARRAANGVLAAAGSSASRCAVWDLEEPAVFQPMKAVDEVRYRLGLPHPGSVRRSIARAVRAATSA